MIKREQTSKKNMYDLVQFTLFLNRNGSGYSASTSSEVG